MLICWKYCRMSTKLMDTQNNPNISHWDADDGYKTGIDEKKYPKRVANTLRIGALQMVLRQSNYNLELKCSDESAAFRIYLHRAGELPNLLVTDLNVFPSETSKILIKSTLITASDALRSYTPHQRQCFFNFERRLQFYRVYTERNCLLECFSSYFISEFGCVLIYMPSMMI